MACCMLGVMFIGQYLATLEKIQRLFGWAPTAARFATWVGRRRRWLALLLCAEALGFAAAAWATRDDWGVHREHLSWLSGEPPMAAICSAIGPLSNAKPIGDDQ